MNEIIIADTKNLSDLQYDTMYQLLESERKEKVDKFLFYKDKKMAVVSEICLYYLLSRKYKYSKEIVEKNFKQQGKPYFKNLKNVYFSISHSNEICAVALSKNHDIGIDIETFNSISEEQAKNILEKNFTKEDLNFAKDEKTLKEKFLCLWTKKEALYKALGEGLSLSNLKKPFLIENIKNLQTIKNDEYFLSIYSSCKNNEIMYLDNKFLDTLIDCVKQWKENQLF